MTAFTPADQAARHKAETDFTRNLCVDAGAGTGKTTILVRRALTALLGTGQGISAPAPKVDELLIITFTEKAAAELRDRLRKEILAALTKAGSTDEERLLRALRGLDSAHIETIHSFASSILRERPDSLGLDPNFEQLDELGDDLELDRAWEQWFGEALEARRPGLRTALNLGMSVDQVRQLARALHRQRDLLDLEIGSAPATDVFRWRVQYLTKAAALHATFMESCNDDHERTASRVRQALAETELLSTLEGEDSIARYICQMTAGEDDRRLAQNSKAWTRGMQTAAKNQLKEMASMIEEARQTLKTEGLHNVLRDLSEFVEAFADWRRAEGKLNFHDLLLFARDSLRDHEDVRVYFRDKFRYILVDEFQDTDPLQVELIAFLGERGGAGTARDWRKVELEPGKVFIVGDPKQSIYRFRRADISVYEEARERVAGKDGSLSITQNFRSQQSVVEWVNGAFERMFQPQAAVQPKYEPITADPRREQRPQRHPQVWALYPSDPRFRQTKDTPRAAERRLAEATAVAGLIKACVNSGKTMVLDRQGDELIPRKVAYRDFAILTRTRTGLDIWEDIFRQADIEYRIEGGRQFFRKPEFLDLLNILMAVDDPTNEVALLGALRSPAFGFSDDELAIFYGAGGRWDYLHEEQPQSPVEAKGVSDALLTLLSLHEGRHAEALPAFVDRVLREFKLVEFSMVLHHGEQRAANLLKVVEQARALWERERMSLRSFTRWLSEREDEQAWEREYSISDAEDDVVQFLTVHAAKGLEFPFVILADLPGLIGGGDGSIKLLADRSRGELGVHVGAKGKGFASAAFASLEAAETAHETAEQHRLLYVAATRARDYLVLPIYADTGLAQHIVPQVPAFQNEGIEDKHRVIERGVTIMLDAHCVPDLREPEALRLDPVDETEARQADEQRSAWLAETQQLLEHESLDGGRVYTATALKEVDKDYLSGGAWEDDRGGRAGRTFGRAFHDVVEMLAFDATDPAIEAACAEACSASLIGREQEMTGLVKAAWRHELVLRAAAATRCWRELDFTLSVPDGVVDGRIDLTFEEGGRLVAVDYKTDTLSADQIEARAAVYRQQAAVYAEALRRLTGRAPDEVWLYFVRLDQALQLRDLQPPPVLLEASV